MYKILVFVSMFFSSFAQAANVYQCQSVQSLNGYNDTKLSIKKSLMGKLKSIELVNEIDVYNGLDEVKNPFLNEYVTNQLYVEESSISESSRFKFYRVSKGRTEIILSDSLVNGEAEGYAYYYSVSGYMNVNVYQFYFYCRR